MSRRIARSRRLAAPIAAVLASLCGCVFTPPPPLPEELAASKAQEQARIERLRAGKAERPAGEPGGAEDGPRFVAGDEPELGMTDEELREYATAQGDPEGGDFTLEEALTGLTGTGKLWARIVMAEGGGVMECELLSDAAPRTVANFVGLARGKRPARDAEGKWSAKPYFDGTQFHRVIEGFMIQGGDPTGTGSGGPGYQLKAEFNKKKHVRGVLSAARTSDPNSAGSQFFIMHAVSPHLDNQYTAFGMVTSGLEVVDKIATAPAGRNDRPNDPTSIKKITVTEK